jgi:hypothetical protein
MLGSSPHCDGEKQMEDMKAENCAQKIILFGTRHYDAARIPLVIRDTLELLITKRRPNIGLEEWSETRKDKSGPARNLFFGL